MSQVGLSPLWLGSIQFEWEDGWGEEEETEQAGLDEHLVAGSEFLVWLGRCGPFRVLMTTADKKAAVCSSSGGAAWSQVMCSEE